MVSLPAEKTAKLLKELTYWHSSHHSFTAHQAVALIGLLQHACFVCAWARFLFLDLCQDLLPLLELTAPALHFPVCSPQYIGGLQSPRDKSSGRAPIRHGSPADPKPMSRSLLGFCLTLQLPTRNDLSPSSSRAPRMRRHGAMHQS